MGSPLVRNEAVPRTVSNSGGVGSRPGWGSERVGPHAGCLDRRPLEAVLPIRKERHVAARLQQASGGPPCPRSHPSMARQAGSEGSPGGPRPCSTLILPNRLTTASNLSSPPPPQPNPLAIAADSESARSTDRQFPIRARAGASECRSASRRLERYGAELSMPKWPQDSLGQGSATTMPGCSRSGARGPVIGYRRTGARGLRVARSAGAITSRQPQISACPTWLTSKCPEPRCSCRPSGMATVAQPEESIEGFDP